MENKRTPGTHNPQPTYRWNYKRIFLTLLILCSTLVIATYGGYSLARMFSKPVEEKKMAEEPIRTVTTNSEPSTTTTTTLALQLNEYTVEAGDTLYGIALKNDTTVEKIKELNDMADDDSDLQIGDVLKLPTTEPADGETEESEEEEEEERDGEEPVSSIEASEEEISKGPDGVKKVALTFDAGAASGSTSQILDELEEAELTATFFLTGKWVKENPELTRDIVDRGNAIGNHTYSHIDLTKEKDNDIIYQLRSAEEAITKIADVSSTKPLFRAPYGARDARVLRVASESGYRSIYWTVDSLDWKPTMSPEQVKNRVLAGLTDGAIILLHCGSNQTATVLPKLIKDIESRGYEIVTVPELFE